MKKYMLFIAIFSIAFATFSQEADTTRIRLKNKVILIIEENDSLIIKSENNNEFEPHWSGVEIGINGYTTNDFNIDLPASANFMELSYGKSIGVNLNFAEYAIKLYKNNIALVTGLGFQFKNYRFINNISLNPNSKPVSYYTNNIDFQKNKLTTTTFNIPLILEFQVPVNKSKNRIHISGGAIGGILIGSHTKQVYKINGDKKKDKIYDDFNLNQFQYGFTARVGYRHLKLFFNYNLSPLFQDNEGPELYPFTAGIVVLSF